MARIKLRKRIMLFTWVICEVEKKDGDFQIAHTREEGLANFSLDIFGVKLGLGPFDFNYFIDRIHNRSGGVKEFKVYCNFKYLFLILPWGRTVKIGEFEPDELWFFWA